MTPHRPRLARALALSHLTHHFLLLTTPTTALANPSPNPHLPFVINTWAGPFTVATDAAYHSLTDPTSAHSRTPALDAVQAGCAACEQRQCDGTVGFGGSPDEACETTLDALLMDGASMKSGAVAGLRRIRDAVAVARAVLDHTRHSLLVGDLATRFAVEMGLGPGGGFGDAGEAGRRCRGVEGWGVQGELESGCGAAGSGDVVWGRIGPLSVAGGGVLGSVGGDEGQASHDTISMVVIDREGGMAAGTSTNGAAFKIPGRVGDGPIVGSGSYVDRDVGGCGATGDGDIMMRFLPCYQAVENLRLGMTPTEAAEDAVRRMLRKYPNISSGLVVVNNKAEHGAAGSGWTFTYAFRGGAMNATEVVTVPPLEAGSVSGTQVDDSPSEI